MSRSSPEASVDGHHAVLQQLRGRRNRARSGAEPRTRSYPEWHAMVAEAAYYCAQRRGFAPGHELDDWLSAEAQIARARS